MAERTSVSGPGWLLVALAAGGMLGIAAGVNPLLASAGVAALGYAVFTGMDVRLGLCVFTVIAFLDVFPVPLGPAASFPKLAGFVLAIVWLGSTAYGRSAGRGLLDEQPGIVLLIVAFLAWATITSAWAPSPGAALGSVSRYALNALLLVIAYGVLRSRRDVGWVVAAYVVGAAIAAASAIVLPSAAGSTGLQRAGGTVGDPNFLAEVSVAGLPLAIALAAGRDWSPALRALGASAAGLTLAGIVLSVSRGGLVALIAVLIAGLVLAGRWRGKLLLIVPLVLVVSGGYFLANPAALNRVTSGNGGTGRTDLWTVGWRMVEARPLLGVGAGNFPLASIHYLLRPGRLERSDLIANTPKVAHNTYLEVLAELGLIGALMFVALIAFTLACGARAVRIFARQRDRSMEMLARSWLIAMVGMLTANLFLSAEFSKQLWLLLALGPALLAVARTPLGTSRTPFPVTAPTNRHRGACAP